MRKYLVYMVTFFALILVSTGCSGGEPSDETTLTFYSSVSTENDKQVLKDTIEKFEKENPNIKIKANYPGDEYEKLLRVKMGANDVPDLFDTHGWAKIRYGEYVEDLSSMDWAKELDPSLEPVLKDDDGKLYAYPLNQAKDGLTYNATMLESYGIEPPQTFDEFMKALEKVKEKSDGEVIPLWFPGKDKGSLARFFDHFATPLLVTDEDDNHQEELLDGTFDWKNYTFLPKKFKEMQDKELLNKDVLTASIEEKNQLFAQSKIAFVSGGGAGTLGPEVQELNPDIETGVLPIPAIKDGDDPSWIGGERHTVAVWKESEHKKEAKKFIDFLSQPEIAKEVAEGTKLPAGLTDIGEESFYKEYYDKYADIGVEPYFDRVYLPSGMWDVMGLTTQDLLSDSLTPEGVSEEMGEEYKRLRDEENE